MRIRKNKPKDKPTEAQPSTRGDGVALFFVGIKALIAMLLVGGVVAGIIWLGQRSGERVVTQPRYMLPFAKIQSDSPPGVDHLAFLTEVRYLSNLPENLQTVEPKLAESLTTAFGRHPWVSKVDEVKIHANARIEVRLQFRRPRLLVQVSGEKDWRAVDRQGVLLPNLPQPVELPQLVNSVLPPTRAIGEIWDDPTILRAAELVEVYQLQMPSRIEKTMKGWRITLQDGKTVLVNL